MRRVHGARGAREGAQRRQGRDPAGLPRRARRSQRRGRLHRHARSLAQDHGRGGARRGQGRLHREADDVHGRRGTGRHRRRRSIQADAAGGQPGAEHRAAADRTRDRQERAARPDHAGACRFNRNTPSGAWLYPIPPDASERTVELGRSSSGRRRSVRSASSASSGGAATGITRAAWPPTCSCTWRRASSTLLDVQAPSQVVAAGATHRWKDTHEVPDTIDAILTYPQGFTVTLGCTLNSTGGDEGVHIHGTKGTLHLVGERTALQRRAGRRGQPLGGALMARGARARVLRGPEGAGHRNARRRSRRRRTPLASAGSRQRRGRGRGARARLRRRRASHARHRWRMPASDTAPPPART